MMEGTSHRYVHGVAAPDSQQPLQECPAIFTPPSVASDLSFDIVKKVTQISTRRNSEVCAHSLF